MPNELAGFGLAWARVTPALLIVPAFGLAALPAATRATFGVALAVAIAPALRAEPAGTLPYGLELALQAASGLPVAVLAAVALYTATMVGGLADNLRGSRENAALPNVEEGASPLGALFSMFVALVFLESGGAARVADALGRASPLDASLLARVAQKLSASIELALAIGAPLVAGAVVSELAFALIARAAAPAHVFTLIAPLRAALGLAITALLFERIAALLALGAAGGF